MPTLINFGPDQALGDEGPIAEPMGSLHGVRRDGLIVEEPLSDVAHALAASAGGTWARFTQLLPPDIKREIYVNPAAVRFVVAKD